MPSTTLRLLAATVDVATPYVQLDVTLTPSPATSSSKSSPMTAQYIDVRFIGAPVELHSFTFTNYYTASLTVLHSVRPAQMLEVAPKASSSSAAGSSDAMADLVVSREGAWQVLVPKMRLMADPHCEDDAQSQHEVTAADFAGASVLSRISALRLCLSQVRSLSRHPPVRARPKLRAPPPDSAVAAVEGARAPLPPLLHAQAARCRSAGAAQAHRRRGRARRCPGGRGARSDAVDPPLPPAATNTM